MIVPAHPGFGGTPRPAGLGSIASLAAVYAQMIEDLDLDGVTVVGNSIGGWIAAEIALLGSPRVSGVVLVDAAGLASATTRSPTSSRSPWTRWPTSATTARTTSGSTWTPARPAEGRDGRQPGRAGGLRPGRHGRPGLLGRLPAITVPVLVSGAKPTG